MAELKPCPFCGCSPRLEHSKIEPCKNSENGDLITTWKVKCFNCGTEKYGGVTEYIFLSDETLEIKSEHFDGRRRAIEEWERRAGE